MSSCALTFKNANWDDLKNILNECCSRDYETNEPFNFGELESTLYTYFYSK